MSISNVFKHRQHRLSIFQQHVCCHKLMYSRRYFVVCTYSTHFFLCYSISYTLLSLFTVSRTHYFLCYSILYTLLSLVTVSLTHYFLCLQYLIHISFSVYSISYTFLSLFTVSRTHYFLCLQYLVVLRTVSCYQSKVEQW